jgi:MSHA biogenesis protein MshI
VALFKKTQSNHILVAAIDGKRCRLHYFKKTTNGLNQLQATSFDYANLDSLKTEFIQFCKTHNLKGEACHWLLSFELYQSFLAEAPKVEAKQMSQALPWHVKDQLDAPLETMLISHYKPNHPNTDNNQIAVISIDKNLVESIIAITESAGVDLKIIDIEELCLGHGLLSSFKQNKITGYIGENNAGLVFSFYQDQQLVFSRYKKGLFIPEALEQEFSLEQDLEHQASLSTSNQQDLQDAVLLETQRTLDYVISQIFRKPVDTILFQQNPGKDHSLAESIAQLLEINVDLIQAECQTSLEQEIFPSLAEVGCALRVES